MNFVGENQCEGKHALVECFGTEDAWITIEEKAETGAKTRWDITGRLDTNTLTIAYSGCPKSVVTYDENREVKEQEDVYEDCSGTVVFGDDGTFTWTEDGSEHGAGLVFKWLPVGETENG